jgi:recombination protein RecT
MTEIKEQQVQAPAKPQSNQMTVKSLFDREDVKKRFQAMLGKRSASFITSVLQCVASNALLAKCDPASIYQSAAVAATLDLPLNNSLGFAYIVPYNTKFQDSKGNWLKKPVAQFQIGYKGYIQLAQRTGQFKSISATEIYEGQLKSQDPLKGFVFDFTAKKSDKVIGYASYFELVNGFEKTMYMSVEEIKAHGKRYSKSFDHATGLWKTDFHSMAIKTVLKLLISKYAPLSIDMQNAIDIDQRSEDGVDAEYSEDLGTMDVEHENVTLMIEQAKTVEELESIGMMVEGDQIDLFNAKKEQLKSNINPFK